MITHLHSTTVVVDDQELALEFYVDKLGWEKRQDSSMGGMRWLTVAPKGAETAIALGPPEAYNRKSPADGGAPAPGISLICDDIRGEYERLSGLGVEFAKAPEKMPWGDTATWFNDPFGNEYFLVELA